MRKPVRRSAWWVRRMAAAMMLGVATTLAAAYGGAVYDSELSFIGYGNSDLYTLRQGNRWWDVVTCVGDPTPADALDRVRRVRSWDGDELATIIREGAASGGWPRDIEMIGWPARCLWGATTEDPEGSPTGLVGSPEWLDRIRFVRHPLPVKPVWAGMAANVGAFGGGWLALLAGPGVVRRWIRRRRGACLGCGYDVRGVTSGVCPECGTPG